MNVTHIKIGGELDFLKIQKIHLMASTWIYM